MNTPLANSGNDNTITLQSYPDKTEEYLDGTPGLGDGLRAWIDECLKQIPNDGKILEIGSGFGRDAEYIRSQGFDIECTDAVPNFVEILQQKDFSARALNALTDEITKGYSMIFADAVLLHFTPQESKLVTEKIYNALPTNGIFALRVKKGNGGEWTEAKLGAPRYFYYWQPEDLKEMLEECGLEWICMMENYTDHNKASWMGVICRKVG